MDSKVKRKILHVGLKTCVKFRVWMPPSSYLLMTPRSCRQPVVCILSNRMLGEMCTRCETWWMLSTNILNILLEYIYILFLKKHSVKIIFFCINIRELITRVWHGWLRRLCITHSGYVHYWRPGTDLTVRLNEDYTYFVRAIVVPMLRFKRCITLLWLRIYDCFMTHGG